MSRSFFELMRKFEETLTGMSIRAMFPREDEMSTAESDRERCANSLDVLGAAWTQDPQDLVNLRQLTARCLKLYAQGEVDRGAFAVKDIDEFLFSVRERASADRAK